MMRGAGMSLSLCLSSFLLFSCSDFLDREAGGSDFTEEQTFSDWENFTAYHMDGYNYLRHGALRINNSWLDAATDLAMCSYSDGGVRKSFNVGNYNSSFGSAELTSTMEHYYRAVRKYNTVIARAEIVPKPTDAAKLASYTQDKQNFVAEARFLRAWAYWEMFLRYGTMPIITSRLNPDGNLIESILYNENGELKDEGGRPTVKQYVVDFILAELADCESGLLDNMRGDTRDGRITKGMARALAARIYLYMASPRYAEESGVTWQQAANAQQAFMNDFMGDYSLMPDYSSAILKTVNAGNTEVIFWRNDGTVGWSAVMRDVPPAEGGMGGNCPTQNLVDMYDMLDGSSPFTSYDVTGAPVYGTDQMTPTVNGASGYNDENPVEGRDPRLAATILYNGVHWGTKDLDMTEGGADNAYGDANATKTGYYMRKYVPEDIFNTTAHSGNASRNWIFIRYAEILLNYAEALNEVSYDANKNTICNLLNQLRGRAGIEGDLRNRLTEDLTSQEAMRNFIHKERTIELAMEEHRAWDVRRWQCATEALSRPIIGMTITKLGTGEDVYTRKIAQTRIFEERMYLYPIPEAEIWKVGPYGFKDNPGWSEY